jgi:peptidoglycan/LPS O-acetylase OafA/YrhL
VAVAIFFLLSGFVISFGTSTKEQTVRSYFCARISRPYSVVAIALFGTLAAHNAGLLAKPRSLCQPKGDVRAAEPLRRIIFYRKVPYFAHFPDRVASQAVAAILVEA